jgi:hypothetical protein
MCAGRRSARPIRNTNARPPARSETLDSPTSRAGSGGPAFSAQDPEAGDRIQRYAKGRSGPRRDHPKWGGRMTGPPPIGFGAATGRTAGARLISTIAIGRLTASQERSAAARENPCHPPGIGQRHGQLHTMSRNSTDASSKPEGTRAFLSAPSRTTVETRSWSPSPLHATAGGPGVLRSWWSTTPRG